MANEKKTIYKKRNAVFPNIKPVSEYPLASDPAKEYSNRQEIQNDLHQGKISGRAARVAQDKLDKKSK